MKTIFEHWDKPLGCPILVVIHRLKNVRSRLDQVLSFSTNLKIKEAEDKELLEDDTIYLAPSNYHLLVERDQRIALSVSEKVNFSRPSIDVTFYNVAEVYGSRCMGILLTGANTDGALGLREIHKAGGEVIVQNPHQAQVSIMPESALELLPSAKQMSLQEIAIYLREKCDASKNI